MTYAHLFDSDFGKLPASDMIVLDVSQLNDELRSVVLAWLASHANQIAAADKLRDLLSSIKFDITAAELGALLHSSGNA